MKIIIAGGGTGGHLYPALAIARALREKYPESDLLFLGTRKGLEARVVPQNGFQIRFIRARGLSRNPLRALAAIVEMGLGCVQSFVILLREKPVLVLGSGGYASAPVVSSGDLLGIPSLVLEQNVIPGKTTRFLARFARKVCVTFPETRNFLPPGKTVVAGNPVRKEIASATREEGRARFQIPPDGKCILVTGASQGAKSINEGILKALPTWKSMPWHLIHLTGRDHVEEVQKNAKNLLEGAEIHYLCIGYLDEIALAYAAADLVICRAGATTLAEVTVRGLPAVVVPYPFAAEAHQERNARWLESQGAAVMIRDEDLGRDLSGTVLRLMGDEETLSRMRENSRKLGKADALEGILRIIEELIAEQVRRRK